jgi:hypothetical protein
VLSAELVEESLHLIPRKGGYYLLQLGHRAARVPGIAEVRDEQLLVVLAVETAAPRIGPTLPHRGVETPAQQVTDATTPPDSLHKPQLHEAGQPLAQRFRYAFLALETVQHEQVARVEVGERRLADPFDEAQERGVRDVPMKRQADLVRCGPGKIRQRLAPRQR